jgi:hypothetical protein
MARVCLTRASLAGIFPARKICRQWWKLFSPRRAAAKPKAKGVPPSIVMVAVPLAVWFALTALL